MIYLIAMIITFIITAWFIIDSFYQGGMLDLILSCFFTIILGSIMSILVCLIFVTPLSFLGDTKLSLVGTEKIVALKDNKSISGSIVLGTRSIDDKMKYVYMTKEDGFYDMKMVDYNSAKVKYSNDNKVELYEYVYTSKIAKFLFASPFKQDQYRFYVPEGSIDNEFKIDLQ